MGVTFKELLGHHSISDIPIAHQQNMDMLLKAMAIVREAWGKPMIVTSGWRNEQDMRRIYGNDPYPKGSAHLSGLAVDIADKDGTLNHWLKNDPTGITSLEKAGLYCEERQGPWQHFQLGAPKSGRRFFNP